MTIKEQAEALRQCIMERCGVEVDIRIGAHQHGDRNQQKAERVAEIVAADLAAEPLKKAYNDTNWYEVETPGIDFNIFFEPDAAKEKAAC